MTPSNAPSPRPPRRFSPAVLAVVLALGIGLGGGAALLARRGDGHGHSAPPDAPTAVAKELYVCPMHPTVSSDHPGDCPICGMKLVLASATGGQAPDSHGAHAAKPVEGLVTVSIDPQRQQLIGLRTAQVTRGAVGAIWRTVGRVAVDETRVHHVNIKTSGFAEQVYVDYVGKLVKRGEPLFTIYSPDLLSVQQEYLLALRTRAALGSGGASGASGASGDDLVDSARERLKLWDIPDAEIARLERTGKASKTLTIYSPMSGVVTKKDLVMGHRLNEGDMPYEITDLSAVWVLADAYESDLSRLKLGMTAALNLQAFPNRAFQGKVIFIDPILDPKTRTAKVRLEFPNPTGELRPEMFGEVTLRAKAREGLRIPGDAVIDSGQAKVVFVALGDGKFQPREVRVGVVSPEAVEVISGLTEGEQVVTRANFLVDSESRLRASLAAMGGK